jgi:hypothetical protein
MTRRQIEKMSSVFVPKNRQQLTTEKIVENIMSSNQPCAYVGPDNFEVKGFSQPKHNHASMFATEPYRQPRVYEVNRDPFVLIQSSSNGDADFSPRSQQAILSQYTELEPQNPASQVIRASVA